VGGTQVVSSTQVSEAIPRLGEGEWNVKRESRHSLPHYVAGGSLFVAWVLSWCLKSSASLRVLWYAGWAIWAVAMALIVTAMWTLRSRGRPEAKTDWTDTSALVSSGVYAIVRHPLYLGWLLVYVAVILYGQQWLTAVIAVPGMGCVYLIARQEDERLVEKFGAAYEHYVHDVPAMNMLVGMFRLVRRSRERSATASAGAIGNPREEGNGG